MAIISLQNISKSYGSQIVLENVSLQLEDDDKIGLIGANGTGKSTIVKMLAGDLSADTGVINRRKILTVGYVHQDPDLSLHGTLHDYVKSAFDDLHDIQRRMMSFEADLHSTPPGNDHDRLAHELADLHDQFESRGGYAFTSRIDEVLEGLGFPQSAFARKCEKLSGGERTRATIARAILSQPDLLLLDEPTNHLDLNSTRWLEAFLQKYPNALVVVSHDRWFLDKVAKRIAEVENGRVQVFKGNYTQYQRLKEEQMLSRRREFDKQQNFLQKEQDFIRRNIAGQRTKEAQGRRKRLERIEMTERPEEQQAFVKLEFQPEVRGGEQVLQLREMRKAFGETKLFSDLSIDVNRGDRLGIIGPSGAGKTTLINVILGKEPPESGQVILGHNIKTGYLPQHRVDLNAQARIIDELRRARPKADMSDLRSYIARFLFTGDDIDKRVGNLSGGEQTRLALAVLILSGANLLVLDEPTNHLDIPSRTALERALNGYEGTIIVVSHDRYLLKSVATDILQISGGEARRFHGDYETYEARVAAEQSLATAAKQRKVKAVSKAQPATERITPSKAKKMSLGEVEKNIIRLEAELESLETQLDDPLIYEHPEKARVLQKSYRRASTDLERLNEVWEAMVDTGEY